LVLPDAVKRRIGHASPVALLPQYEPHPITVHRVFQPRRSEVETLRAGIAFAVPLLRKSVIGKVTSPLWSIGGFRRDVSPNRRRHWPLFHLL
jgi:hypothetical protein